MVLALPEELPVCILGDQLQAIFGFGGREVVAWTGIEIQFPHVALLEKPWRWINAEEPAFGQWLFDVRSKLIAREAIDLRDAPSNVKWRPLIDTDQGHRDRLSAVHNLSLSGGQTLLILGEHTRREVRADFARSVPGVSVLEPVELPDLITHSRIISNSSGVGRIQAVVDFAAETMTGIRTLLPRSRIDTLANARQKIPPSSLEEKVLRADKANTGYAIDLIRSLRRADGVRLFRNELFDAMIESMQQSASMEYLLDAAIKVRERRRMLGRKLYRRSVGSTLLMKGLEAHHAIILDADRMDRRHLYVALTRASKSITVFSSSPVLKPGSGGSLA